MESVGEKWCNITGDFDIIVFREKERILALEDTMDCAMFLQFINDFFQIDYGNAGQIAWNVLFNNLKSTGTENILILQVCNFSFRIKRERRFSPPLVLLK